jgi:hypothetical protein
MTPEDNTPNHLNSFLDKLVLAGWIEAFAQKDRQAGNMQMGIKFTPEGGAKLQAISLLIAEIESKGGSISNDEMPYLKAVAQLTTLRRPPDQT